MILGIDVGQKNLGVCVVSTAEPRVIAQWAVWDSAGSWALEIHACLVQNATQEFLDGVTRVVIERQPSKNPSMTRIMHYLEFFFVSKGFKVTLQDPKHKLLYAATTPWFPTNATDAEWTYRHRKKLAVQTTASFLDATNQPLRGVFDNSKKKTTLPMRCGTPWPLGRLAWPPPPPPRQRLQKKRSRRAPRRTGSGGPASCRPATSSFYCSAKPMSLQR